MGELRLTSIGVEDLLALFSGSPGIESHLRGVAAQAWPAPPPAPSGRLLGRIGPLTRVPADAPVIKPDVPTAQDLSDVTRGRFVRAERLGAAWALIRVWLDACGWPTLVLSIDEPTINELDFELATGGVETRYALRRLLNDRLALPLRNAPGQVTGYVPFAHADALRRAWRPAIPTLSPHTSPYAHQVVSWLSGLDAWAEHASRAGRPAPDLVASFQQ